MSQQHDGAGRFAAALADYRAGRFDAALAQCTALLEAAPDDPDGLNLLAAIHATQGDLPQAIAVMQRAVAAHPAFLNSYVNLATYLQQANLYAEAAEAVQQALAQQPDFLPALISRLASLRALGRMEEAAHVAQRVTQLQPGDAVHWLGYGDILYQLGRFTEAVAAYDAALARAAGHVGAHHNKAATLYKLGRYDAALASCDAALALAPALAALHKTRGSILQAMGREAEACASYEQALALKPDYAEAMHELASSLQTLKRYEEALGYCDRALAITPYSAELHANRGNALFGLKRFALALTNFDQAIALKPGFAEAFSDRGNILMRLGRYDDALASYEQAITLNPDYAEAHNNKGFLLQSMGQHASARVAYDRAIACDASFARAYFNKATVLLLDGEFAEGWKLYEWRWQQSEQKGGRDFGLPLWLGDADIRGKTILLHAEQGLGDAIQFCRFVPQVEALGAQVVLEVPPPLVGLVSTLQGKYRLVAKGQALPPADYHCPLMSLPRAMKLEVATIPHDVPYLAVSAQARAKWQQLLGAKTCTRIGLAWSGAAGHKNDHQRSLPLPLLMPLLAQGVEFHAVQKDVREEDRALLGPMRMHGEQLHDFSDTAALVEAMDLVISVDTSAAHVAGALAKPVWVLLPFAPDYRWLTGREDSPWYPTARLFRQPAIGDWQSVVSAVISALTTLR